VTRTKRWKMFVQYLCPFNKTPRDPANADVSCLHYNRTVCLVRCKMLCDPNCFVQAYTISDYRCFQRLTIRLNVAKLVIPDTIYNTINYGTPCIVFRNNPSSMGIKKAAVFSSYSSVGTG
jgi:hypothetical protein